MRNSFTTLAAFVFGVLISISIIACADDYNDKDQLLNSEELREVREKVILLTEEIGDLKKSLAVLEENAVLTSFGSVSFKYDNLGRVTSVIVDLDIEGKNYYSITYSETGFTIIDDGGPSYKCNIKNNTVNTTNKIIWNWFCNY